MILPTPYHEASVETHSSAARRAFEGAWRRSRQADIMRIDVHHVPALPGGRYRADPRGSRKYGAAPRGPECSSAPDLHMSSFVIMTGPKPQLT